MSVDYRELLLAIRRQRQIFIRDSNNDGRHPPLCFFPSKGPGAGNSCFLDYHNDVFFGLAKKDCNSVVKKTVSEWVAPNGAKRDEHAKYMTEFMETME